MVMGYIWLFTMAVLTVYWVSKSSFFTFGTLAKKYSYLALFLKLSSGVALWLIYTYYYTDRINSDIFKYFDDAVHLFDSTQNNWLLRIKIITGFQNDATISAIIADTNFWDSSSELLFNDNRTMIRIHMALLHFSGGLYLFHLFIFSFLSFIGYTALFQFFRKFSHLPHFILFLCCCCIPSLLFWASAPLKESITIFGLGLFLLGSQHVERNRLSTKSYFLTALGLFTLISIKLYILFALLPGLWFWVSSKGKSKRAIWLKFIWVHTLLFVGLFSNQVIDTLSQKQQEFKKLIETSGANSAIEIGSFDSFLGLVSTLPKAIFNVLIRPIYPPNWSVFSLFAAAEHLLFLGVLLLLFYFKKALNETEQRLALFCISFVLIGSLIIGLTVPVLGGIVRYKVPLLPFYLIAIFSFINFSKLTPKLK